MGKRVIERAEGDKCIFVAEVFLPGGKSTEWVDVVLSIAGRDSTFSRRWQVYGGRLEAPALEDISAYVARSVTDSVLMMLGVQEVLPLS